MKRRGFEESLNQHSVNKAIINSQNMKLCLCSHTHDYDNDVGSCRPKQKKKKKKKKREKDEKSDERRWHAEILKGGRWWWRR